MSGTNRVTTMFPYLSDRLGLMGEQSVLIVNSKKIGRQARKESKPPKAVPQRQSNQIT